MLDRKSKGFTLIELLIVVAIIGIIAAIAIPNLLNAIDRGKQKRTMADIRSIGTAVEAYSVDTNIYPTATTAALVQPVLEPTYIKKMPMTDGWSNSLIFQQGATAGAGYTVRSYGKDNTAGVVGNGGKTTTFAADIIFVDGQFTQWPEGVQN
jgi:general secretion pathway protein G